MRYGPRNALVVVDMQVDFGPPDGGLYVAGGEQTIAVVNEETATAVAAGSPVFYTRDWHPPVTPHFAKDGGIWPVHCVAGTPGAELLPGLNFQGTLVHKGITGEDGYSGFMVRHPQSGETGPTELDELLQQRGHASRRRRPRWRLLRQGDGAGRDPAGLRRHRAARGDPLRQPPAG